MNYKLWILTIAWIGIIFILVLGHLGFNFISVVSNSMKHENEELFIQFWAEKGCDTACIKEFSISKGFQGGDLLILKRTTDYKIGDVLSYQSNSKTIIHRLIDLNETHASFQEDNIKESPGSKIISEEMVERNFIIGKIIFKIPKLGLVKALLNCWGKRCDYIDCFINGDCN